VSTRQFDAAFYRRYYRDPRTRVITHLEMDRRGALAAAAARHLGLRVRRILDAGCGLGLMRRSLLAAFPGATYTGLEVSEYLCRRYGWVQGSLADFGSRTPFDLVICYDVPQYLDDRAAGRALSNLARLCRGLLAFHALTRDDWQGPADRSVTDAEVYLRTADWYRRRLRRSFTHVGFGLHVRRGLPVVQWSLEEPRP
jgi:SAM-dependent methyltransferase